MESSKPWLHKIRASESFVVIVVSIAIFTDVFIYGMVVPIIPVALVERVGTREEDAQYWVSVLLAVYGATLLIGSPLFGWFADHSRYRKLPFVIGLLALGASTLLFIVARSMVLLIIARGLQGFSAAGVWVVGLAIVVDNVSPERVGEAMGQTTIGMTWGFLLGPTIGGVMYEKLGFYGTFMIPVALIALDVILRFAIIEVPRTAQNLEPTFNSQAIDSQADAYNTSIRPESQSSQARNTRTGSDQHCDEQTSLLRPSTPCARSSSLGKQRSATIFSLLTSPRLPLACTATIVMAVITAALETTIPLYVMQTFGWSSGGAGLIFVASSIPSFAGVLIGKLIDRIGVRIPAAAAFSASACAWILMRLVNKNTTADIILLTALLFILGLAAVTVEIIAMTEASQVVGDYEIENPGAFGEKSPVAQTYALLNMAFAGGQLLGPILAGAMRVRAGWAAMTLVLGVLCAVTAVPIGLFSGAWPKRVEIEAERDG
ncbi:unnamed protein product [Penicillium pancosmium]